MSVFNRTWRSAGLKCCRRAVDTGTGWSLLCPLTCWARSRKQGRVAGEKGDALKIVKLNVDENQQTAMTYEVLSIPTLILFKNGAIAKKVVGAYPKRKLEAELEPVLAA